MTTPRRQNEEHEMAHRMSDEIRTAIAALESDAVNEIQPTEMSLTHDAERLQEEGDFSSAAIQRRAAARNFRKASQNLDAAIDALMRALHAMEKAEQAEALEKEREQAKNPVGAPLGGRIFAGRD